LANFIFFFFKLSNWGVVNFFGNHFIFIFSLRVFIFFHLFDHIVNHIKFFFNFLKLFISNSFFFHIFILLLFTSFIFFNNFHITIRARLIANIIGHNILIIFIILVKLSYFSLRNILFLILTLTVYRPITQLILAISHTIIIGIGIIPNRYLISLSICYMIYF
jgi:hypothetical protein